MRELVFVGLLYATFLMGVSMARLSRADPGNAAFAAIAGECAVFVLYAGWFYGLMVKGG